MPPSYVPRKRGMSCLGVGCLILAGVVGVIVFAGIYSVLYVRSFVTDHPVEVRENQSDLAYYQSAVRKLQLLIAPPALGASTPRTPVPAALSADELNALAAHSPQAIGTRSKCFFSIPPGDLLVADFSAQLPPQIARNSTYYFNGRIAMDLRMDGKTVQMAIRHIESLDGHKVPDWLLNTATFQKIVAEANDQINRQIQSTPNGREFFARIGSSKIENGHFILYPPGTPSMVATPASP